MVGERLRVNGVSESSDVVLGGIERVCSMDSKRTLSFTAPRTPKHLSSKVVGNLVAWQIFSYQPRDMRGECPHLVPK